MPSEIGKFRVGIVPLLTGRIAELEKLEDGFGFVITVQNDRGNTSTQFISKHRVKEETLSVGDEVIIYLIGGIRKRD